MSKIKFVDAIPPKIITRRATQEYADEAAALTRRPGAWAILARFDKSDLYKASNLAWAIRQGRKGFGGQPGVFTATSRQEGDSFVVYAQCLAKVAER